MKKVLAGVILAMLLSGCGGEAVYETIADVWEQTEPAVNPGRFQVLLPEGAEMEVMDGNGDSFYRIGDWSLWTKVTAAGDVEKTLSSLSGMDTQALTVIHRNAGEYICHETTWTATAEDGAQVIRTGVLDDGSYHYCICICAPETEASEAGKMFEQILASASIINTDP